MLEAAETAPSISPEEYEQLEPQLRTQLVQMQQALRSARFPIIIVVSGDDAAGVRNLIGLFSEWMDPRFVTTRVFSNPTPEELAHPAAWRYWRELPANGRVAVFSDDWTTHSLALRLSSKLSESEHNANLEGAERFERMLSDDGAVFLKIFLHLPEAKLQKQRKRLKTESEWSDVAIVGRQLLRHPTRSRKIIEDTIRRTSPAGSPWTLIESTCKRYRNVTAARLLLEAANNRLNAPPAPAAANSTVVVPGQDVLSTVDLSSSLTPDDYDVQMDTLTRQLRKLTERAHRQGVSIIAAFEGQDAAGKGGTIRRLAATMNPELYRIVPIAAPTDEEKAHHYLWRFWRHIPPDGGIVIFDRTWYGRVLVERVEGFASPDQWGRAYDEINYFEHRLTTHRALLLKFWLQIDQDEQLRRFQDRENTPYKAYKIGPEDYRNREKWDQYVLAINDMVARTSTPEAPWRLIPSNDKKFARVEVLRQVAQALKKQL